MSICQPSHFSPKTPYRKNNINYEQIIEKQLIDDFQVYQYLNENKLQGNNVEEYSRLYNSLLVEKDNKFKQLEKLNVYHQKLKLTNNDESRVWVSEVRSTLQSGLVEQQYEGTQSALLNEIEVKKNLWKQIIQSKKSLSLLKGDIGHLVSRNQSAKLLESKISKVKIVADDQFKRVSLAFGKDKEEIKIRNQMQKTFNFKLKNVSMFEDMSLNRMKKSYIELMSRRKDINDRLAHIEKVSASIHEYGDMNKQKNLKNYKSYELYIRLKNLAELISTRETQHQIMSNAQFREKIEYLKSQFAKITKNSVNFNPDQEYKSQTLQIITQENLNQIENKIMTEFHHLESEVYHRCCLYNESIRRIEQYLNKQNKLQQNIQDIINRYSQEGAERLNFTGEEKIDYQKKLKEFRRNITILFKVLTFFHKNNQNKTTQNYVSQLHQIYMFLIRSQQSQQRYTNNQSSIEIFGEIIHKNLQNDIKEWLNSCFSPKKHRRNSSTIKELQQNTHQFKAHIHQIREDSDSSEKQKNAESETNIYGFDNASNLNIVNLPSSCTNSVNKVRQSVSLMKKKNTQSSYSKNQYPEVKAERIQYLETVDQDYYKMLKNTLKMQKQNTRKNYQFMRSFKRTKYANRDQILAQKRFQSKFSVLLTNTDTHKKKPIRMQKSPKFNTNKLSNTNQYDVKQLAIRRKSREEINNMESKLKKFKFNKKLKEVLDLTEMI